jgi:hypothetical protein
MNTKILIGSVMLVLGFQVYGFFGQIMQMPQQIMSAGSQMAFPIQGNTRKQPQTVICDCKCSK